MSEQNVETVRRLIDAFNRGDFEASLAFLDEEIEWHDPVEVPGPECIAGRKGCAS